MSPRELTRCSCVFVASFMGGEGASEFIFQFCFFRREWWNNRRPWTSDINGLSFCCFCSNGEWYSRNMFFCRRPEGVEYWDTWGLFIFPSVVVANWWRGTCREGDRAIFYRRWCRSNDRHWSNGRSCSRSARFCGCSSGVFRAGRRVRLGRGILFVLVRNAGRWGVQLDALAMG